MKAIDFLIDFILVLIAAVIIIAIFPAVLDIATKPISETSFSDLTFTQQSAISSNFNKLAANIEACMKNGKQGCMCPNVIPDHPYVFDPDVRSYAAIEIIPSQDLRKFTLNMTINGRGSGMTKEIQGQIYVFDGKQEIEFKRAVVFGIRAGSSAILKLDKMKMTFGTEPKITFEDKDYSNPSVTVQSAGMYKISENALDFVTIDRVTIDKLKISNC